MATTQAVDLSVPNFPPVPSTNNIWNGNWEKYKASRVKGNDCDLRESENWLGTGVCKYSWECRGARMCEGTGWCYGSDGCDEVNARWKLAPGKDRTTVLAIGK